MNKSSAIINYKELFPENHISAQYVHSYTYSIGELNDQEPKYITRAFPTFFTNFYFEFQGGLSEIRSDNTVVPIKKRSYLNHEIGKWSDIYQLPSLYKKRVVKNFKVDFYPNAVFEIFGVSPSKFEGYDIRVEDIWGDSAGFRLMFEEMENAVDGKKMVEIFERELLKKIKRIDKDPPYIPYFLIPHENLKHFSKKIGYSPRWIQKKHKEIFGYSFKVLQGNIRFLKVLDVISRLASSDETINFTSLAHDFSYYDQAHFIKDFKKYTGMTPSEYTSKKFQNLVKFHW